MAVDVLFPQMSEDDPDAEGVVGTWFVTDGQHVTDGQLLAEVQVEKVAQEVHAPATGTVRLLVAEEGVAKQGDPIAAIA